MYRRPFLSPAKAGSEVLFEVIPGRRSLRSLARGYYLSPLRGSLTQINQVDFRIACFQLLVANAIQFTISLWGLLWGVWSDFEYYRVTSSSKKFNKYGPVILHDIR